MSSSEPVVVVATGSSAAIVLPSYLEEIKATGLGELTVVLSTSAMRFVTPEVVGWFAKNVVTPDQPGVNPVEVALHARSSGSGEYVTVAAHLPEHKVYSETQHQAKYEEKMRAIGEEAHAYFRMLLKKKPGYWKQTVKGILGLMEQYGSETVNLSLKRALHYEATDVTMIKNILAQKLYAQPLEPVLPKTAEEVGTLGRELTYYTVYDANSLPITA